MPLFGKKKKESKMTGQQTALAKNETTYFGKNLQIKGRVSGNGNVIILGGLNGEFRLKGRLKIAQPAKIKGEVNADVISVNGSVHGSLTAHERVHLDKTARIRGRINTTKLSIMEGAIFDGEINMGDQTSRPAKPTAADAGRPLQANTPSVKKTTTS